MSYLYYILLGSHILCDERQFRSLTFSTLNFSCEQDSNLMGSDFDNEESGVPSIKRYWAVLYVFKFYNSNDMFFSCTVTVCPSGSSSCDIVSIAWAVPF